MIGGGIIGDQIYSHFKYKIQFAHGFKLFFHLVNYTTFIYKWVYAFSRLLINILFSLVAFPLFLCHSWKLLDLCWYNEDTNTCSDSFRVSSPWYSYLHVMIAQLPEHLHLQTFKSLKVSQLHRELITKHWMQRSEEHLVKCYQKNNVSLKWHQ